MNIIRFVTLSLAFMCGVQPYAVYAHTIVGPSKQRMEQRYTDTLHQISSAAYIHKKYEIVQACDAFVTSARKGAVDTGACTTLETLVGKKEALNPVVLHDVYTHLYQELATQIIYSLCNGFIRFYETSLAQVLDAEQYWQWAQDNPWRYFFSKSPVQWVRGKKQHDAVHDKLREVKALKHMLYAEYGALARHISLLHASGNQTDAEKAQWLHDALRILYALHKTNISLLDHQPTGSFVTFAEEIQRIIAAKNEHCAALQTRIAAIQKPHYLARRWIPTLAVTATACAIGAYYNNNTEMVHDYVEHTMYPNFLNMQKSAYEQLVQKPKQLFYEFMGYDKNGQQKKVGQLDPAEYDKEAEKLADAFLEDSNVVIRKTLSKKFLVEFLLFALRYSDGKVIAKIDKLEADTRLTRYLFMTLPGAMLLYGGYKGLSALKHHITDYDSTKVRMQLSGVFDLLVCADQKALTDEHYGMLVHNLTLLHKQVRMGVPTNHRKLFYEHLKKLGNARLNIVQKKELIQNMRATYDFLAPGRA